jgi:hypothetical protein
MGINLFFVNHVNTYFRLCILLITHKGLGKVTTLHILEENTHLPMVHIFCINGIMY